MKGKVRSRRCRLEDVDLRRFFGGRTLRKVGAKVPVDQERAKWNQGGAKHQRGAEDGPAVAEKHPAEDGQKRHEKNAMDPADDFHGLGNSGGVFERHGDEEQDEEGNAFDDPEGAQVMDGASGCHVEGLTRIGGVASDNRQTCRPDELLV